VLITACLGTAFSMSAARATREAGAATQREPNTREHARRASHGSGQGEFSVQRVRIKDRDACWTVAAIDPFAVPLAAFAARFKPITPNRLTLLSTLVAAGAAVAFGFREFVLGAIVYQLAFLLDCMDGKVASIRGLKTSWGGFFDVAGDTARFVTCFSVLALVTVAGHGDTLRLLPVVLYPCARFGLLAVAESRPSSASRGAIQVVPRWLPVLNTAPRRATKPGTTVDAELIALTVGPILHATLICFAIAAALHLVHAAVVFASGVRAAAVERSESVVRGR
jgi:phosphatidylglycerophosphate synthase